MTNSELVDLINASLPTNGRGQITAAVLRSVLIQIADSLISSDLPTVIPDEPGVAWNNSGEVAIS